MIKAGRSCAVWSFAVIDEVKNDSDASTDVNDSIEDVNDFLFTASAAAAVNSLDLSSAEIADREIKMWKTRTVPFPKDKNPLDEWRHGAVHLFPWLCVLVRCVLAIPATSAAPKSLFSTAGNVMTKKRWRLTCDNMEELVYLHRCGRSCGSGRWSRRCAWSDFFWNQWNKLPSMSSLVSFLLTRRLHLNDCDFDSRPLFLVSLFLSLYMHICIYILLLLLYTIFPGSDKTSTGLSSG